jgi:hypothetical protein
VQVIFYFRVGHFKPIAPIIHRGEHGGALAFSRMPPLRKIFVRQEGEIILWECDVFGNFHLL